MRHQPVSGEKKLWACLRGRQLGGLKFRRQFPVGGYIADFACCEAKLIVESDGDSHGGKREYDARRDGWFEGRGWRVIRVLDLDIAQHLEDVLEMILREAEGRLCRRDSPSP